MKEIKAYQCEFCKKLFKTATHHGVCKDDPTAIHCGDCKNYTHIQHTISWLDDDDGYPEKNVCSKRLMANGIPRRRKCAGYEHIDLFDGVTLYDGHL